MLHEPKHEKVSGLLQMVHGPTRRALKRYQSVGCELEEWNASFGHT